MSKADLNLLVALDTLLSERSVAKSARILGLSASAMSRTLSRLREATGDPLLVRSGRALVPTPRALELKNTVGPVVRDAETILRPQRELDLETLQRTFVLRTSDIFVENFGAALIHDVREAAPGVALSFVQKIDSDQSGLLDGAIDLEVGVVSRDTHRELRTRVLFRDRFIGVVSGGHPMAKRKLTPELFANCEHVEVSHHAPRAGSRISPIDAHLKSLSLQRNIVMIVGGFATALSMVRQSHLFAAVPEYCTENLRVGLQSVKIPFDTDPVTLSAIWHPRFDADPAHRWLRDRINAACRRKK